MASRSPPESSGIDWSIFRDGEDDTFAWLWRTSSAGGAAATTAAAETETPSGAAPAVGGGGVRDAAIATATRDDAMDPQRIAASLAAPSAAAASASSTLTAALLDSHLNESSRTAAAARAKNPYAAAMASTALSSRASVASSVYDDYDEDELDEDEEDEMMMMSSDDQGPTKGKGAAGKGKQAKKRRKTTGEDEQKKQQRRVKNLASVREFRKRKMKQMEENEIRLRRLEAENMDLKMRLKIGKDALLSEQREKQEIKEQMQEMLQRGASEQEVARFVNMYKVTYSDYGPKRREKLQFHLARIRELLLPTQVTKLCLYSVEQGSEMIARDKDMSDDSISVTDAGMAPISLWGILAKELNVSPAQQRQLLERRESIEKIRDDLNKTLGIVKKLEEVTDYKNTALESQIAELQHILTPSQATKFIIWVKENPAFMYMLDKLVDSTLRGTDA